MKYNDYPLMGENLVRVLSEEYANSFKVGTQQSCKVSVQEQKSKLNELYTYIYAQNQNVIRLKKENRNFNPKFDMQNHLNMLCDMGADCVGDMGHGRKHCLNDYYRCEVEIFKVLMFLLLLDNLNYNKASLSQILNEQMGVFEQII